MVSGRTERVQGERLVSRPANARTNKLVADPASKDCETASLACCPAENNAPPMSSDAIGRRPDGRCGRGSNRDLYEIPRRGGSRGERNKREGRGGRMGLPERQRDRPRRGKEKPAGSGRRARGGQGGGGGGKMDSVSEVQLGLKLVMARERKAAKEKGTEEDRGAKSAPYRGQQLGYGTCWMCNKRSGTIQSRL